MRNLLKMKSVAVAIILSVCMMGCATTGGGSSSISSIENLILPILTQVLQGGNTGMLAPLLSNNFTLGGKTGTDAANLATQVLNAAPAISNISLKNTTQSNGNTILNTVMDVAGKGQVSSPVVVDQSGKISSLGILQTLLSSGILNKK